MVSSIAASHVVYLDRSKFVVVGLVDVQMLSYVDLVVRLMDVFESAASASEEMWSMRLAAVELAACPIEAWR